MARLTGQALHEDILNTVIEDSEPEREAEQKAEREKRKAERKRRKEETKRKEGDGVILVSDSEPTVPPTATQLGHREPTVIEISDTTLVKVALPCPPLTPQAPNSSPSSDDEVQNLLAGSSPYKEPNRNPSILDNAQDAPIDLSACMTSYSEPESSAPKLNLARFAFGRKPGPGIKQKLGSTLPKPVLDATTPEETTRAFKVPKTATPLPPFANSFTTSQLAALSKCVVCDLAWTARKTVPVKMMHVKSCARKNGWHEATIIARLTTEIGHLPATIGSDAAKEPRNKKSRGKKTTVEEAPKTYLEDVVNESGPKKRKRKGPGAELVTVLNPQDAHAGILERAKTLFGTGGVASTGHAQNVSAFPSTQEFRPSKLGSSSGPNTYVGVFGMGMLEDQTAPATAQAASGSKPGVDVDLQSSMHAFRSSVLGGAFAKRSIFERDESGNNALMSGDTSPTKTFGKNGPEEGFEQIDRSVLGGAPDIKAMFPPRQPLTNPNADQVQARPSNPLMSHAKPLLTAIRHRPVDNYGAPSTSHSANDELYLPKTLQKRLANFDRRLAEIHAPGHFRNQQEDPYPTAHTVFENVDGAREQARQEQGCRTEGGGHSKGKQKAQSSSSLSSRSTSRSRSRSRSRKSPRRRKSRSPGEYQQVVPGTRPDKYCNENFDEDMYRIIKENMELYLRVLRYEPIHFDVFLNAAAAQGMAGGWLRMKLRAFLDRQAINFYGDNALASNRRRYK